MKIKKLKNFKTKKPKIMYSNNYNFLNISIITIIIISILILIIIIMIILITIIIILIFLPPGTIVFGLFLWRTATYY